MKIVKKQLNPKTRPAGSRFSLTTVGGFAGLFN